MASTYSQIYIQAVVVVKGRECLIQPVWKQELYAYMAGIIKAKGQKPIIINGVADHVHIFFGLKPTMAIADLMRDVKNNSTNYINKKGWVRGKFAWQAGYGAFSYSHSQIDRVYQYIQRQEEHHQKQTFRSEYLALLQKFEVPYEEQYLFDWLDEHE